MIEICVELALCVGEQGKIKFLLFGAKVVPANNDSTRWQSQVIGLLELRRIGKVNKHLWLEDLMVYLRPAEHHTIEQDLQLLERIYCLLHWKYLIRDGFELAFHHPVPDLPKALFLNIRHDEDEFALPATEEARQ